MSVGYVDAKTNEIPNNIMKSQILTTNLMPIEQGTGIL